VIRRDNTLSSPHFKQANGTLKTFDFAVANPPFSTKAWSNGFNPAEDESNAFPTASRRLDRPGYSRLKIPLGRSRKRSASIAFYGKGSGSRDWPVWHDRESAFH
jgi:hypothetical protein